jgi:hypothetical protein
MAKKEIVKVPFDGERFKEYIEVAGYSLKDVAAHAGCSETTLRRAAKYNVINQDYLTGEKTEYYAKLAKAVKKVKKAVAEFNALIADK